MKKSRCFLLAVVCIAASVCLARTPGEPESGSKLLLKDGWRIQPSTQVHEKGDVVSTTQFKPRGWYPAGIALVHRIPPVGLKCVSAKRRREMTALLGGEQGSRRLA